MRFLADPSAEFTKQAQLDFDGSAIFGGARSKRYALVIQNGKVKSMHVEPDNTGIKGRLLRRMNVQHIADYLHRIYGVQGAGLNSSLAPGKHSDYENCLPDIVLGCFTSSDVVS